MNTNIGSRSHCCMSHVLLTPGFTVDDVSKKIFFSWKPPKNVAHYSANLRCVGFELNSDILCLIRETVQLFAM